MRKAAVAVATFIVLILIAPLSLPFVCNHAVFAAGAQSQNAKVDIFTIYVGYLGFNDTSGNLTLSVGQGDTVRIKFVWNDSALPFVNAHQVGIDGYNLQSGVLNDNTNTSVVQFTASLVGTFRFHCVVPCLGNDALQNGWLKVKPAAGKSVSTVLSIISLRATNGSVFVAAHLASSNGTRVVGATVDFSMQTDFGVMSLGSNTTTSNGNVHLDGLMPFVSSTEVFASFPGGGSLNSSSTEAILNASAQVPNQGPPYISGQAPGIDFRVAGVPPVVARTVVGVFILVLASVYAVIALVVTKILRIKKKEEAPGG